MDKISYEDFLKEMPSINDRKPEQAQIWKNRHRNSFIQQMSDVWGEAEKCVSMKNENKDPSALNKQIEVFMDITDSVLTDSKMSKGAKIELREAEWEILDYCIWDNEWKNRGESALAWFNQWIYDYNLDLMV